MKAKLTEQNIKDLRYQCRMGYIIPFFFFILGSVFISLLVDSIIYFETQADNNNHIYLTIASLFIISILINYLMNGKYIADIKKNEKELIPKTIQHKEANTDFEAGSANVGPLPHNRKMNTFMRYD